MGVAGVLLVGFAMFVAYLYSQGKTQKLWDDAFGTAAATTTTTNTNSGAGVPAVSSGSFGSYGNTGTTIAPGAVSMAPAATSSATAGTLPSLAFPQITAV